MNAVATGTVLQWCYSFLKYKESWHSSKECRIAITCICDNPDSFEHINAMQRQELRGTRYKVVILKYPGALPNLTYIVFNLKKNGRS